MLTYSTYLRLTDLLAQQRPRSSPAAHDELMFITVHQASELWFKLLLFELGDARDLMLAGHIAEPRDRLRRCRVIVRLLADQFDVLDTMAPADFKRFRHGLGRASGVQSAQFAEIERLSGLRDSGPLKALDRFSGTELARLRRRLTEPTVWDGFINVLAKAGFDVSSAECRSAAYVKIAENPGQYTVLWDLMEALLDHDQTWSMWRTRHLMAVARQIGARQGTSGTAGFAYLADHQQRRFYPELWELGTRLMPERPGN